MERSKVIYDNYVLFDNGVILSLKTNRFIDGYVGSNGYIQINLNRKRHQLHRLLAQAFIENANGLDQVDHIDHNRLNNNLSNLRWCTSAQNSHNRSKRSNNASGEIGISKRTNHGKPCWRVQVHLNGKSHTRIFKRDSDMIPQEAIDARDMLKRELHGDFAFVPDRPS
jgi:hypothetical protein